MLDIHLPNPYIRVAMRSTLPKGSSINRRIIFDYELIYISDGCFTLRYADRPFECSGGQFLLIRPGIPHSFEKIASEVVQPHFHFDMAYTPLSRKTPVSFKDRPALNSEEQQLIQEDVFHGYPQFPYVSFSDKTAAIELFYAAIDSFSKNKKLAAKGIFISLLDMLISDNFPDSLKNTEADTYEVTRQVKDFIDSRNGVGISLDSLEKQFSYSKYYLERRFGRQYGVSIMLYCSEKKTALACEMLRHTTVSKVAYELGFSSVYSFSRAFKSRMGVSPTEYLQRHGQ